MSRNHLRDLVEAGLEPEPFQSPLPLMLLGRGKTYHGFTSCGNRSGDPKNDKKATPALISPLEVDNLCSCWVYAIPSTPQGDAINDAYNGGSEIQQLLTMVESYETMERPRKVGHLRNLLREAMNLNNDMEIRGAPVWCASYLEKLRERLAPLEEHYRQESTRGTLLAWCALTEPADANEVLEFDPFQGLYNEDAAMRVVRDFWEALLHHKAYETSLEDLTAAFGTALVEHASWEQVDLQQFGFVPSSTPLPGETLENYILREWKNDVASDANLFVRLWLDKWSSVGDTTWELVAYDSHLLSPHGDHLGTYASQIHEIVEAWRLGDKGYYTLLRVPQEVSWFLGLNFLRYPKNDIRRAVLTEDDTDEVLETALSLWDMDASGAFPSLEKALDAARRL